MSRDFLGSQRSPNQYDFIVVYSSFYYFILLSGQLQDFLLCLSRGDFHANFSNQPRNCLRHLCSFLQTLYQARKTLLSFDFWTLRFPKIQRPQRNRSLSLLDRQNTLILPRKGETCLAVHSSFRYIHKLKHTLIHAMLKGNLKEKRANYGNL